MRSEPGAVEKMSYVTWREDQSGIEVVAKRTNGPPTTRLTIADNAKIEFYLPVSFFFYFFFLNNYETSTLNACDVKVDCGTN